MSLYDLTIPLDDADNEEVLGGTDAARASPADAACDFGGMNDGEEVMTRGRRPALDFLADNTGSTEGDDDDDDDDRVLGDDCRAAGAREGCRNGNSAGDSQDETEESTDGEDGDEVGNLTRRHRLLRRDVVELELLVVKIRLLLTLVDLTATGQTPLRALHRSHNEGAQSAESLSQSNPSSIGASNDQMTRNAHMLPQPRVWADPFCFSEPVAADGGAESGGHHEIAGIFKLRERVAREVTTATAALHLARTRLHEVEGAIAGESAGGVVAEEVGAAVRAPRGAQPFLKCNLVNYLETFVLTVLCEPGVLGICYSVRDRRPLSSRTSGCNSGSAAGGQAQGVARALDADVVSCHGARWVKVKAFSEKNARQDMLGQLSERKHFTSAVRRLVALSRDAVRIPFGAHPEVVVVTHSQMPEDIERGLLDESGAAAISTVSPLTSVVRRHVDALRRSPAVVATIAATPTPPLLAQHLAKMANTCASEALTFPALASVVHPPAMRAAAQQLLAELHGAAASSSPRASPPPPAAAPPAAGGAATAPAIFAPRRVEVHFINFDVTALVALVSDTCNGFAGARLARHRVLDEQAQSELRSRAVEHYLLPTLRRYTQLLPQQQQQEQQQASSSATRADNNGERAEAGGNAEGAQYAPRDVVIAALDGVDPFVARSGGGNGAGWNIHVPLVQEICPLAVDIDHAGEAARSHAAWCAAQAVEGAAAENSEAPGSLLMPWERLLHSVRKASSATDAALVNWVVTDVALSEFSWIIDTIAGEAERQRAQRLITNLLVIPAGPFFSDTDPAVVRLRERSGVLGLADTGKIMFRHKAVFGVGELLRAVTLSANQQFVQAARDQGVEPLVRFHPSRALTERKRLGIDRRAGPRRPPEIYPSMVTTSKAEL